MNIRFDNIQAHAEIAAQMKSALATGRVAHTYLICGEDAEGIAQLAEAFAAGLQCTGEGEKPCGVCPSCRKAADDNHPDIIRIGHEKPASIGVDEVREQLVNDVAIRPYESERKVYLLAEADKLTLQAQNALLATLEEPPSYAVILLAAENPDALLPTVLSRCTRFDVAAPDDEAIRGKFSEITQRAVSLMKRSKDADVMSMIEAVRKVAAEKSEIEEYLDAITLWFRDVLLFKATRDADSLIFEDEVSAVRERAKISGYEGLNAILAAIETARERLRANVNPELTLELLFLTIKEN